MNANHMSHRTNQGENDKSDAIALLLAASRQRRRARGVAMVEGALIFPIMAMFIYMLELAHHNFDAYITAEHVAEERTWSSATYGSMIGTCPKDKARDDTSYKRVYFKMDPLGGGSDDPPAAGNPSMSAPNGGSGAASGKIAGAGPGGWFMHHDTASAEVKVARGPRSFDKSANARSKVFCNQPWVGSLWDVIKSL